MIILTNCINTNDDEGGLKTVKSIIEFVRQILPDAELVTYGGGGRLPGDLHLRLNKLMLSLKLARLLRNRKDTVLYLPKFARMLPTSIRVFVLSCYTKARLRVLLPMCGPLGRLSGFLFKWSGAEIILISRASQQAFEPYVGTKASYIKMAVDTDRFRPANAADKQLLRRKYGLPSNKSIVLHVGHLKEKRKISCMAELDEDIMPLLVTSSLTACEEDQSLRRRLEEKGVLIFNHYIPQIEEIYQLADVYLFPVTEMGSCIDAPLSVFEAAACGIPIVMTPYGELQQLCGRVGFTAIENTSPACLNAALRAAIAERGNPRPAVLEYDWRVAVSQLVRS